MCDDFYLVFPSKTPKTESVEVAELRPAPDSSERYHASLQPLILFSNQPINFYLESEGKVEE